MRSNQRSPMWPYLLVLAGLFVLSVAVPRGWQDPPRHDLKPRLNTLSTTSPTNDASPPLLSIMRRLATSPASDLSKRFLEAAQGPPEPPPAADEAPTGPTLTGPMTENVAEKIARALGFNRSRSRPAESDGRANRVIESDQTAASPRLASTEAARPTVADRDAELSTAYWPVPRALLDQLDRLSKMPRCQDWAGSVEKQCVKLCRTPPGDAEQANACIEQLQALARQVDELLPQLNDSQAQAELRRARYSLERRLLVWNVVMHESAQKPVFASVLSGDSRRRELSKALDGVESVIRETPWSDNWRRYLRLQDVDRLASDHPGAPGLSEIEARQLARRVLSRLEPREASAAQREILEKPALQLLAGQLRYWAAEPVERHDMLATLERYESDGLPSDGREIVREQGKLIWSTDERDRELGRHLDNHYRNANIRIVLADDLVNRLVPEESTTAGRVDDSVLGNPVSGLSITSTRLRVKLIPDPRRVHAWIEAHGTVDSSTRAYSGPATFSNRGEAAYAARKAVVLDRQGLWIAHTISQADSDSWLTGVRTDYDGIPLIGSLARNYAVSQQDALRGEARQEIEAKVATRAGQQLNTEVDRRLAKAEARVRQQWLDPLKKMGLELQPITLETIPERVTMRFRLAGAQQPGGHTSRPHAPSDSLASAQIHESVLNNVLDKLELAGRTFALPDLYKHLADRTSRPLQMPDDVPDNVFIQFADNDPVRVRCQDGRVELTLAIDQLRQGSRMWHDFLISTTYVPELDGRHARLVRDGTIQLGGDTYRGQPEIVLRGIFSKILSRERDFELLPAFLVDHPRLSDLAVTQCDIVDGWIALAMGPDRNAANRPTTAAASAAAAH